MIESVSNSAMTAPQNPQSDSSSSLSRLAGDYNSFLQLLTAQVSNQDPLKPMDSSTFVTQLAQLSQVEQTVKVNSNLEGISSQIASAGSLSEVQLIGRTVTVTGNRFQIDEGTARLGYTLAGEADQVAATIRDSNGAVVATMADLPKSPGARHIIEWDGLNAQGEAVVSDSFTVEIVATNEDAEQVSYTGYVPATVDSVLIREDVSELMLNNGEQLPMTRILEVN